MRLAVADRRPRRRCATPSELTRCACSAGQQLGDRALRARARPDDGAHAPGAGSAPTSRAPRRSARRPATATARSSGAYLASGIDESSSPMHVAVRLVAADRHPLVAERRPGDRPALVDLADDVVVGHEHVVEEDLVEQRLAGDLAQRAAPRRPSRCMSIANVETPACLAASGSVRTVASPCVLFWAPLVHTFWPLTSQPPSTRVRAGLDRGGVGAGVRFAEQLAPVAARPRGWGGSSARPDRRCRAGGASAAPTCRSRAAGARRSGSSSSITSCSTAPAPRPHGLRPVRHAVARVDRARRAARASGQRVVALA